MKRIIHHVRPLVITLVTLALMATASAQDAGQEAHVELILDASGSMFNRLDDGRYRVVAAKEVLAELIAALPADPGLNVGYRAYGSELQATAPGSCEDSRLYVPIEGVQRQQLLDTVRNTQARGATPIAYSLQLALEDLRGRAGTRLVVLITDGEEGCGGDVRAAAAALQAEGIDLRIIGFDLDKLARDAFEGLGRFENATSAAELLAALTRAVEEASAPATATYPVTVTLLRGGEPAADGPVVEFLPAVGAEADAQSFAQQEGAFRTDLPAGAYSARVSDAHSGEPLLISGLVVTPEGDNAFEFELAPMLSVTLTPSDEAPNAGATITIAWEGAPGAETGYIALSPAGEDLNLLYVNAPSASGQADMRLPSQPGDYDLRYLVDQPNGASDLLGLASISLQEVAVSLSAPAEVGAGGIVEVDWQGPDNLYDYITIVVEDAPENTWGNYTETATGNPLRLRVPNVAGDYQIRYNDGYSNDTLGRIAITVTDLTVAFSAPTEAVAGSVIVVEVTRATAYEYDYITVVEPGTHEDVWGYNYVYIDGPGEYELRVDEVAGDYLLRYQTESEGPVLASQPLTILPASASISAVASVGVGEYFDVQWEGPGNYGDYVTIVPVGTPDGDWGYAIDVSAGSPLQLYAGDEPGQFELRYQTGQLNRVLTRVPITVR